MPFIITTFRTVAPGQVYGPRETLRLQAVIGLQEMHTTAFNACAAGCPPVAVMGSKRVNPAMSQFGPAAFALTEEGGSIGPLPDETVVEVTPIGLQRMVDELRHAMQPIPEVQTTDAIVTAYNAAMGKVTYTIDIPGSVWDDAMDPMASGMQADIGLSSPRTVKRGRGWTARYENVTREQALDLAEYIGDRGGTLLGQVDPEERDVLRAAVKAAERIRQQVSA